MKNSNDKIGNRTRDLPNCSAVPQPTAPPHAPESRGASVNFKNTVLLLYKYSSCQIFAASSLKRRISTCRSKGCRMTSNLCTQCWNSEWHRSTGTYGIVTLIISGSASGWKGFSNVSITEMLLCLFHF